MRTGRCLSSATLVAVGLLALPAVALAAPAPELSGLGSRFDDGSAVIKAEADRAGARQAQTASRRTEQASPVGAASSRTPDPYVYRYLPGCSGNSPNGGNDDDCTVTRASCPGGGFLFFVWRAPAAPDGTASGVFEQVGRQCMGGPGEPGAPAGPDAPPEAFELPGFTQADFQRLPLPAGTSTVQPGTGEVLIRTPTNTYAEAEPVELETELVGFPVVVRATPVAYTWDYGDGTVVGPTEDAGAPWPDLRVTHSYERPGDYAITLTTTYEGEYSILGGAFLPIPGTAEVASESQPVTALAGVNVPVADTLG